MSFKLSVRQGPRPNLVFELDQPGYVIGREAGNEIVIEDPQVSRRHAQLTRQGNSYLIEDIGSTNGTYVNGKRVTAPTLLANGDMIGLADTVIIAVQAPLPVGEEATVVSDAAPYAAAYAPPTVPAFTPPVVQPQPAPKPVYVPPPPMCASGAAGLSRRRFSRHRSMRRRSTPLHNTRRRNMRRPRWITPRPTPPMINAAPCSSGWAAWDCCWW